MSATDNTTNILVAAFSFLTAAIAWVFRDRIAGKKKKTPIEVLIEGYERLLKQYQQALGERDIKIDTLEKAFQRVQSDLNAAKNLIDTMKEENAKKQAIITDLELKLTELRKIDNMAQV